MKLIISDNYDREDRDERHVMSGEKHVLEQIAHWMNQLYGSDSDFYRVVPDHYSLYRWEP